MTAANPELLEHTWYHGTISRVIAEERLSPTPIGTFLVRDSSSHNGFSLSLRVSDRVKHYIIQRIENDAFQLVGKDSVFGNIPVLVEHYHSNPVSSSEQQYLKKACPRPIEQGIDEDDVDPYASLQDQTTNMEAMNMARRLSRTRSIELGLQAPKRPSMLSVDSLDSMKE